MRCRSSLSQSYWRIFQENHNLLNIFPCRSFSSPPKRCSSLLFRSFLKGWNLSYYLIIVLWTVVVLKIEGNNQAKLIKQKTTEWNKTSVLNKPCFACPYEGPETQKSVFSTSESVACTIDPSSSTTLDLQPSVTTDWNPLKHEYVSPTEN